MLEVTPRVVMARFLLPLAIAPVHRAFDDTFKFILDPGHPAKHVSSLLRAHNRDTAALNCTTNATLETVLQQCGHTEAEVCTVCVCRRRGHARLDPSTAASNPSGAPESPSQQCPP